jgi:DNA-binding NarL/FixJ family response regulator
MRESLKTVALLVANPALSSILATTLAGVPMLRVRPFESEVALATYLKLAPADLVVADFDSLPDGAERLAGPLRQAAGMGGRLRVLALASERTAARGRVALGAGFDEIIMKPMSPKYLVERVLARLAGRPCLPLRRPPLPRDWSAFGDNVVPLFR